MVHHKCSDVFIRRAIVYFQRAVQLFNRPVAHYHDPVGQEEGLLLVMGDIDHCGMEFFLNVFQFPLHDLLIFNIQCADWLIEQNNGWV